jgi:UDP-glucose 4-epimerase
MLHNKLKKTILLTGCAGFIGSQLLKELVKKYSVVGIDDLSVGNKKNLIIDKNFRFIKGDCSNNKILNKLNNKIDIIIHFAGQSSGEKSFYDPLNDFKRNLYSTINLLNFASKFSCSQFIYASSMSVYGNYNMKVKETDKKKPLSFYGISKSSAEEYIKKYITKNVNFTILRLFNIYGAGQRLGELRQGMIRIFLTQIYKNKKLVIKGSKYRYRDLLNITDCTNFIKKIILNKKTFNKIINVGSGKKYFIHDIVRILKKKIKFNFTVKYEKKTVDDQFGIIANNSVAKKITGYTPKIDLNNGIEEMIKKISY